jgi:hypothetical protein
VGFTKVSALGVEEQRVLVIVDFTSPREVWEGIGDGYRLEASFILWEEADVLRWLACNRGSVDDALTALSLGAMEDARIRKAVEELVDRNMDLVRSQGERAISPLMGDLMKSMRGKVDGKVLHEMLRAEISRRKGLPR